jgi:acetyl esterase/lipase
VRRTISHLEILRRTVAATRYDGMIHDFVLLNAIRETPEVKAALSQVSARIRAALRTSDGVRDSLRP